MRRKKEPHFVYLLRDNETVVYVGCTKDLHTRMKFHRNKKYNNVEVIKYSYKLDALSAERQMLIRYMPKYNWIPKHLKLGQVESEKKFGTIVVKD